MLLNCGHGDQQAVRGASVAHENQARARGGSNDRDCDEVFKTCEILRIAGVDGGVVGVSGSGDEQVHHAGAGLTADGGDAGGELGVAVGDGVVDGQRVEAAAGWR
jgi:hypothetical protein